MREEELGGCISGRKWVRGSRKENGEIMSIYIGSSQVRMGKSGGVTSKQHRMVPLATRFAAAFTQLLFFSSLPLGWSFDRPVPSYSFDPTRSMYVLEDADWAQS
jgi:hypothetical protein